LQVAGSLGMAKGSEFFAGDDVVMELPKHDRPLVKYPEVAMTAATTAGYTASVSRHYSSSYTGWMAFDRTGSVWITGINTYDTTDGTYLRDTTFEGVDGEYLKLEMPKSIKLKHVKFTVRTSPSSNPPNKGRIYGSNDDATWIQLHAFDDLNISTYPAEMILPINSTEYYRYYVFQIEEATISTDQAYASVNELEYYGYEEGDTSVDVVHRSIPNKPGQQHLEVYWDANDSNSYSFADSDAVYDLSGNGVTATISGAKGFNAKYNSWILNNNLVDYISSTLSHSTGAWAHSVSTWMYRYPTTSTNQQNVFQFGTTVTNEGCAARFEWISNRWMIRYYFMFNDVIFYLPGHAKLFENWIHITATYDGGSDSGVGNGSYGLARKLYINGVPCEVQSSSSPGSLNLGTTSSTFYLGHRPSAGSLIGEVANARVYSKALSAEQVRELYEYDAPRFGHRQNLVALHKGNLGVGVAHPTSRFEVAGADGVQEYPPKAMTGFETYMEGHGVFKVHKSGDNTYIGVWPAWEAFNEVFTDAYHGGNFYTGTDYAYAGTETLGGISGDYVILELPYKIKAKQISLAPYPTIDRTPEDFTILGSNDNVNWTKLATFNGITNWTSGVYKSFNINSDEYFNHFAVVVTRLVADQYFMISEIKYYGTPAPSAIKDGHLTLGKALTLPRVSGHPAGAETPRAESLVVHYDTTVDSVVSGSTVVDISGEGNNGDLINGAAYSSTDRTFTFDGSNDSVGWIPNAAMGISGDWVHSFSGWFKFDTFTTKNHMFSIKGPNTRNQSVSFRTETTGYVVSTWYGNNITWGPLETNKWYHVCLTYPGSASANQKLYINGELQTITDTGSYSTEALNITTITDMRVGALNADGTNYLDGSASKIKFWNVALTAEEVAAEYALGRTGKSINLTDTSLCLGGTVPRAQLDVRGGARFDGYTRIGKYDFEDNSLDISRVMLDARGPTRHMGILLPSTLGNNYTHPPLNIDHDSNPPPWEIRSVGGVVANRYNPNAGDGLLRLRAGYYAYPSWIDLAAYNQAGNSQTIIFGTQGAERMRIRENGNVGIGSTNPNVRFTIKQSSQSSTGGLQLMRSENESAWQIYINADGTDLYFAYNGATKGFLDRFTSAGQLDFTGQHRSFIDNVPYSKYIDLEGLIVSANKNKYFTIDESIQTGSNAIQISESLPLVSLSTKEKDKACFGVISGSEDPESRKYSQGSFVTVIQKQKGDQRALINSVGEGAMWVTNINGPLESGDYITTSNVAGYGQRQDDDVLHNYTVAKITMDCDFNPPDIPVQRILKELANVTYWYQLEDATSNAYDRTQEETYYTKDRHIEVHGHVDEQSNVFVPPDHDLELYSKTQVNTVSEEVYNALPEDEQALYDSNTFTYTQVIGITPEVWADLGVEEQNTYAHGYFNIVTDEVPSETPGAVERTRTVYKNVVNETKVEPVTPEDYLSEVREEWVNVLDENNQIQWEDVPWGDTEPAYKLRYLDAEGQITTRHNAVHIAAFVGVTYHCG
jgi:hypothetical protein